MTEQKPVVLISPYRSTAPLIRPLQETGFDVWLLDQQQAAQFEGASALQTFVDEPLRMAARSETALLDARVVSGLESQEIYQRMERQLGAITFSVNGTGPDAVKQHILGGMSQWFPGWVQQSMARQILWLKAMERLCKSRDVRAVVVQNDVEEMTKTLVLFAAAHGIPTVHVPHAVYLDWGHGETGYDVHDVVSADWVCAAGWYQAEWYKERGARRVDITGLPQWDQHIMVAQTRDRDTACRRFKLDVHKPVVSYFSSWRQDTAAPGFHDGVQVAFKSVLQAAKGADWQLLVKTHPSASVENAEWHARMAKEMDVSCLVTDTYLDGVYMASDAALAFGTSNTVLESAIYGIPTASIYGFQEDEAIVTCNDQPEMIGKAVGQALSDDWRERYVELRPDFVRKYVGDVDGKATQRVYERVARMAGRGKVL